MRESDNNCQLPEVHYPLKIAVIDCGSNSFRYLLVQRSEQGLKEVTRDLITVRLGQSLHASGGTIDVATKQRSLDALAVFKEMAYKQGADCIVAVGTSALRSADNAYEFIKLVERELSLRIQVISGAEEAELSFRGATKQFNEEHRLSISVLDIGGGSTELMVSHGANMTARSVPLGAVRLTNMFIENDPPLLSELNALRMHVQQTWHSKFPKGTTVGETCIGVAGTITNLAAMYLKQEEYKPEIINGTMLNCEDVEHLVAELCLKNLTQRKQIVGLQPERADIIIAGGVVLETTMKYFGIKQLQVSEYDLMHAIAWDWQRFCVE